MKVEGMIIYDEVGIDFIQQKSTKELEDLTKAITKVRKPNKFVITSIGDR